jgi:hypothetical protein
MSWSNRGEGRESRLLMGEPYWSQIEFLALVMNVDPVGLVTLIRNEIPIANAEAALEAYNRIILSDSPPIDRFDPTVWEDRELPRIVAESEDLPAGSRAQESEHSIEFLIRSTIGSLTQERAELILQPDHDGAVVLDFTRQIEAFTWAMDDLRSTSPRIFEEGALGALAYVEDRYGQQTTTNCILTSVEEGSDMPFGGLVLPRQTWCHWWLASGQVLPDDLDGIQDEREIGVGGLKRSLLEKQRVASKLLDLVLSYMVGHAHWGTPPLHRNEKVNILQLTSRLTEMAEEAGLMTDDGPVIDLELRRTRKSTRPKLDYISRDHLREILRGCICNTDKEFRRRKIVK